MSPGGAARLLIWAGVFAGAWFFPSSQDALRKWGRIAKQLARRRALTCVALALMVLLPRLALLPVWPMPIPYIYDEFGYILQADTFASGRLTNPPHPMAHFFESIYILQAPTYNAKFPPGQGLMLSLGQMLFDHPWLGVWLSCGVLAAALCWALQQWFPPGWALFGSMLALPLCLTSYWMNSYWGGAVTGIGSALVLGACGSYVRPAPVTQFARMPLLLGIGSILLMYTRPFEGIVLLAPVFLFLLRKRIGWTGWIVIALTGVAGAGWLAYYNQRVTGDPLKLPYVEYDRQYPSTPHLNILPLPPAHKFDEVNFAVMDQWERDAWAKARRPEFLLTRPRNVYEMLDLFLGSFVLLLPVALFGRELLRSPRLKLIRWCLLAGCVPVAIGIEYYQHYAAPILPAILILTVEAFRRLRLLELSRKPVGRFLTGALPAAMLLIAFGHQAHQIYRPKTIEETYPPNARMQRLSDALIQEHPGGNVVFVRYTKTRMPQEEWIYNRADIDNSQVIWAQDLGPEQNRRLMDYYEGRAFWLLKPDENADTVDRFDGAQTTPK